MSKFHVQFDPATDSQALIVAAIAGIFAANGPAAAVVTHAAAPAPATLHPLDNPAVGADAAGEGDAPATAANADGTVRFDKDGLPWDGRIHSDPPTMTKKNVWRAKRGLDDAVFAAVAAELRARFPGAQHQPAAVAPAPAAAQQLPVNVAAPGVNPGTLPTSAAALASLPGLPGLTPPPAPVNTAYQEFTLLISSNMAPNGKLTEDYVKAGLANYGVPGGDIKQMATMEESKVKAIHAAFAQVIAG